MAAAPYSDQQQFQFHHSSPLDTLVRKTSTRKPNPHAARDERRWPQDSPSDRQPTGYQDLPKISTERAPYQVHHAAPSSPLLHSHFKTQSTATWTTNDNASYLDLGDSNDAEHGLAYGDYDVSSITTDDPAIRDSWQSNSNQTIRPEPTDGSNWSNVPSVMVSEAPEHMAYTTRAGKTPIIRPTTANFSRPARTAVEVPDSWEIEQKQRVLERNASRRTAPNTPDGQFSPTGFPGMPPSERNDIRRTRTTPNSPDAQFSPSSFPGERNDGRRQLSPSGFRPDSSTSSVYSQRSVDASQRPQSRSPEPSRAPGDPIQLPRRPPSLRPGSPASLYSDYSFYQLDSATPSPTDKQFLQPPSTSQPAQPSGSNKRVEFANSGRTPSGLSSPSPSGNFPMRTAQEFLQLGIQHHEADRLAESAVCFEKAATLDGGCGVGMLMWGLALRHGWGCSKNEKQGFKWLRRAAEHAVSDLESARNGGAIDEGAVQTELVLAIYEVGQCFFHGWGIPKDQKMGVSYYMVAARMGDADAQMDLGFCLANGKGAKKDRKEAAKWYRAAVKQGQSDIGLAWIYKEKFQ
ncbi:hypothetical protein R3P38DRAFT_3178857 [Favolaschia claudopus]|uniref:HCP-like protein n=1 Tax=Favolaschia claudopus TaxID=2862362 RepID=A0AAW0CSW0_9AGAR